MASLPNSTPPPAGGSPLDSTLTDNTQLSLSTRVACKKIQRTTAHSHGGTHHPDCPHQSVETEREGQNRRPAPRSLERKRRRRHRWLATRGEAPSPEAPPPPVFACSVAPRCELFTGSGARLGSGDSPPHPEPKGVSAREEEEDPVVSTMLLTLFSLHVMYSSFQLCMVYDLIYLCFC